MKYLFNFWGTLTSPELEDSFLNDKWLENKNYTFLTYFLCCFFFLGAGLFGDFQRVFYIGSAKELLLFRVFLLMISLVFILQNGKKQRRPKSLEIWLDSMKYISTVVIVLLTYWTRGTSLTLLPGIMMMLIGFYMILPGRIMSTNVCALTLLITFAFLQDPVLTYGKEVHHYMTFMLVAIEILLCFFKIKHEKWARTEYMSKKELDSLNETKDKLLATIGHDIRSPLALIQSRAELSLLSLKDGEFSEVTKSQSMIIKSVSKLDNLLSDIVNWAISDLKEGRNSREVRCITKTMGDAVDFILEVANQKRIRITKELSPYPYFHEPRMMTTCFRNILSNAIKYNPFNSEIHIRGSVCDDFYHIEVIDQGPGLGEELAEKIKSGLNDSSEVGTEGERGSGLGLKLVKNIVDNHGGKINIYANVEGGATFKVSLPLLKDGDIA